MNPIIPGTPADRTGTLPILRRAVREINRRWAGLQADVLAILNAIPVYVINAGEAELVRYGLTADQMARLSTELQAAVERWIADGRDPANLFWWSRYVAETQQLGTAQTVANLGNLSPAYAAARSIEMVIYSEPVLRMEGSTSSNTQRSKAWAAGSLLLIIRRRTSDSVRTRICWVPPAV